MKKISSGELRVPAGEQAGDLLRGDARGIFRQEALLRHGIEAAEQGEPLVGDERHDVALAFDRPQLERQRGAQRVCGWDHVRARQLGAACEGVVAVEAHQIGNEQEQPSPPGGELPLGEDEVLDVGDRLHVGADAEGAFLVEPARQRCEAFLDQHLAYRGGAQRRSLLLERPTDLVDRIVALAQRDDLLVSAALLGLRARARMRGGEEFRKVAVPEGMAQHAEGAGRIAETACDLGRGQLLQVKSAQGLVLALAHRLRHHKEAAAFCYAIWCADRHICAMSHTRSGVKP